MDENWTRADNMAATLGLKICLHEDELCIRDQFGDPVYLVRNIYDAIKALTETTPTWKQNSHF
jgi:hypothetical protein